MDSRRRSVSRARTRNGREKRRFRDKRGSKQKSFCSLSLCPIAPLSVAFFLLFFSFSTSSSSLSLPPFLSLTKTKQNKTKQNKKQVVEERRHWPKFGDALNESATDSITVRANEEIPFERARAARQTTEERKASDMKSVLQGTDKSAIVGSLKDLLYKRRMERQLAAARGLISGPEMSTSRKKNCFDTKLFRFASFRASDQKLSFSFRNSLLLLVYKFLRETAREKKEGLTPPSLCFFSEDEDQGEGEETIKGVVDETKQKGGTRG